MDWPSALLGFGMGGMGAALHLSLTWYRARRLLRRAARGTAGLSDRFGYVGGLGLVIACLLCAVRFAGPAVWAFPLGFSFVRWNVLRRAVA